MSKQTKINQMDASTAPKLVPVQVKVADHVLQAMKNETLRRQLKGEQVHQYDVHREWLEKQAAISAQEA